MSRSTACSSTTFMMPFLTSKTRFAHLTLQYTQPHKGRVVLLTIPRSRPSGRLLGCAWHLHCTCTRGQMALNLHKFFMPVTSQMQPCRVMKHKHRGRHTCHLQSNGMTKLSQHSRTHKEVLSTLVRPASNHCRLASLACCRQAQQALISDLLVRQDFM